MKDSKISCPSRSRDSDEDSKERNLERKRSEGVDEDVIKVSSTIRKSNVGFNIFELPEGETY